MISLLQSVLSFLFISLSFYLSVSSSFHQTFQVYFFLLNVIEADLFLIRVYYIVKLVLFIDWLNQEINHCLLIHVCNAFQSLFNSCHWSRLTVEFWCHYSRLTSSVVQADSLLSDKLSQWDQSLSSDSCLLHACCKVCFVHVYYMHVVKLVSFMSIAFDRACFQVTSLMTRSIIICSCSRLTILVIQADSFYSASNIQRWMSFSSYLRVFRHIIYVLFFQDI